MTNANKFPFAQSFASAVSVLYTDNCLYSMPRVSSAFTSQIHVYLRDCIKSQEPLLKSYQAARLREGEDGGGFYQIAIRTQSRYIFVQTQHLELLSCTQI